MTEISLIVTLNKQFNNSTQPETVDDMRLELLQYLFTLRYYENSVPCAKGYTENENKIIAYLQFVD